MITYEKIKVISNMVINKTKFIHTIESLYLDKKGQSKKWVWASRPNNQHAVVIPAVLENKLVLIREFRVPINRYIWGFPAGLIDHKESFIDAAYRWWYD